MNQPTMNMACVSKCVKNGKPRSQCMKTCYPDSSGKPKKGGSKKAPPFGKGEGY